MQITTERYESLREGKNKGDVEMGVEKGGEEAGVIGSPKHPMHARFFPRATQKSRRVACTRRGLCRDCSRYNDRLIKKRFVVAVNRGTRIYAALCTSYSSGLQSYAARELGKHVCQNASLFFFFFFFIEPTKAAASRNWRQPELGCGLQPLDQSLDSLDFFETFLQTLL